MITMSDFYAGAYQGLGSYSREKEDFFAKRETESTIAHQMRIRPHLQHAPDAEAEQAAQEEFRQLRAQIDNARSGEGVGLSGRQETPQSRAAALGHRGFGERAPEARGHLNWEANPGQPGVSRVYLSQIQQDEGPGDRLSPLLAWARSNANGS